MGSLHYQFHYNTQSHREINPGIEVAANFFSIKKKKKKKTENKKSHCIALTHSHTAYTAVRAHLIEDFYQNVYKGLAFDNVTFILILLFTILAVCFILKMKYTLERYCSITTGTKK